MSRLISSGCSRSIHYFDVHGEINTEETIRLAHDRTKELNINFVVVASETGLSALKVLDVFSNSKVVVISSAYGTFVEDSPAGDLRLGITDKKICEELGSKGATIIRGTDPFWNLSSHTDILDTGKLGMMFYKVICSGLHVCITAVLEATDSGNIMEGDEVIALAGSFVGLDTAIVATASNSVNFFKSFELNEIICKPRKPRYTWPINNVDWKGNLKKYSAFSKKPQKD